MKLILVSLLATLANQDAQWMTNYGKAIEAARTARKPLLVVLDKPSNDGGIHPVSHRVAASLLKPYVLCHIDVATPYGQKMAKAFRATSFPHTAIIDSTGKVILATRKGELGEATWSALLTKYRTGRRPVARTSVWSLPPQQCLS